MKYPNNIKKESKRGIIHANRGMTLESDLNLTNQYYLAHDIAIINKKPTPIKVVKVTFDNKKNATIKEAYFQIPSTTDYNGIYKGKYIDFEAKEVRNKKCFPISNINAHQIKHLENVMRHGGIAFIIVRFTSLDKTFILKGEILIEFIKNNSKSIPIEVFNKYGYQINETYIPRLNYINIINKYYLGGQE